MRMELKTLCFDDFFYFLVIARLYRFVLKLKCAIIIFSVITIIDVVVLYSVFFFRLFLFYLFFVNLYKYWFNLREEGNEMIIY